MDELDASASSRLQQRFSDMALRDGAIGFQGVVNGDMHINQTLTDSRNNLAEAAFNSANKEHVPICLEGTRTDVLAQIRSWADGHGEKGLYWLKGMAGTGKSTIALTIAREYYDRGRLGASFFFVRGGGDLGSARRLPATISCQLEEISKPLKKAILEAAASSNSIDVMGLYYQWGRLVMEPLSTLPKGSFESPVLIVIDALDECDSKDDMALLIKLFAKVTALANINIRVLITSRPETPIALGFEAISDGTHRNLVLHDIEQSIVDQDIVAYYHHRLSKLRPRINIRADAIKKLVQRSHGLFIHAATVCMFIQEADILAEERLTSLLDNESSSTTAERALDHVYSTVLEQLLVTRLNIDESNSLRQLFCHIVGSIVTLSATMTVSDLARILTLPEVRVRSLIDRLHSVLDVPPPEQPERAVRLIHPSFRDFLLDPLRNRSETFFVGAQEAHGYLLNCCFSTMETELRRNMCDFEEPATRTQDVSKLEVNKKIHWPTQYACRYWVYHLGQAYIGHSELDKVAKFFQKSFLFWLETLAWVGRLSDALVMVSDLIELLPRFAESRLQSVDTEGRSFFSRLRSNKKLKSNHGQDALNITLQDVKRFLLFHSQTIQDAPLQTYCSAILFSPQASIARRLYSNEVPRWIQQQSMASRGWSRSLRVFEVGFSIWAVALSSSGGHAAIYGGPGHFVEIVDLGSNTQRVIRRLYDWDLGSLSFSPDDQTLLARSATTDRERTFRLFDVATGSEHLIPLRPEETVLAVGFSPHSTLVLSKSKGAPARLWNLDTAETLVKLDGITDGDRIADDDDLAYMMGMNFSPDGELLVARGRDTVQIWVMATGRTQQLAGDNVVFSNSSNLVALISYRDQPGGTGRHVCGISVWQFTGCWSKRCTLSGSGGSQWYKNSVVFSPNCGFIAGSSRGRACLWDTNSGKIKYRGGITYYHSCHIAFSPDSRLIAWGAADGQIRICRTDKSAKIGELDPTQAAFGSMRKIVFSPGGDTLTSVCGDYIQVWDTSGYLSDFDEANPASHLVLDGVQVTMSKDCKVVAAAYEAKVELWDAAAGSILRSFVAFGHADGPAGLALSPDGRLAAASFWRRSNGWHRNRLFQLWNVSTDSTQDFIAGGVAINLAISGGGGLITSLSSDGYHPTTTKSCLGRLKDS
ncbi:hypothetical protein ACHAPT_008366 [Fusarium lateritium]